MDGRAGLGPRVLAGVNGNCFRPGEVKMAKTGSSLEFCLAWRSEQAHNPTGGKPVGRSRYDARIYGWHKHRRRPIAGDRQSVTVSAEDALIAALKVKHETPEAIINYVRRSNRRGDRRHPHKSIAAAR